MPWWVWALLSLSGAMVIGLGVWLGLTVYRCGGQTGTANSTGEASA